MEKLSIKESLSQTHKLEPIRVLFFTESFIGPEFPGLQAQLYEECLRLSQKMKILVITQEYREQVLHNNLEVRKVSRISFPILKTLFSIAVHWSATFQNRKKFDILYVRYISLPWIISAILSKKILHKKLVIWLGSSRKADTGIRGNFFKPFLKIAINNADFVGSSSYNVIKDVEEYLGKIDEKKIVIFSQAVDTESFKPEKNIITSNDIITVARINPEKGLETIIDSIPFVIKKFPNAKFKIIGPKEDQSYFNKLQKIITTSGVSDNIEFVGSIPHNNLAKWYNSSKVFVLTSKTEEQSIVTLEAMSCGKSVVVTPVGALSELIDNGKNGFLVPPEQPEKLAEIITHLLEDRKLREDIGKAARTTIEEKFTWKQYITSLVDLFGKVKSID